MSLDSLAYCESWEVCGDTFFVEEKERGDPPGIDLKGFMIRNWSHPMEQDTTNLNMALTLRPVVILRNNEGEIVGAFCYGSDTEYLDVHLIVLKEEYKKKGIGKALLNRVVDSRLKEEGPLKITADAQTAAGGALVKGLEKTYGKSVDLLLRETYKLLDDYDLPDDIYRYGAELCDDKEKEILLEFLKRKKFSPEEIDCFLNTPNTLFWKDQRVLGGGKEVVHENEGRDYFFKEIYDCVLEDGHEDQKLLEVMLDEFYTKDVGGEAVVGICTDNQNLINHAKYRNYKEVSGEKYFSYIEDTSKHRDIETSKIYLIHTEVDLFEWLES